MTHAFFKFKVRCTCLSLWGNFERRHMRKWPRLRKKEGITYLCGTLPHVALWGQKSRPPFTLSILHHLAKFWQAQEHQQPYDRGHDHAGDCFQQEVRNCGPVRACLRCRSVWNRKLALEMTRGIRSSTELVCMPSFSVRIHNFPRVVNHGTSYTSCVGP